MIRKYSIEDKPNVLELLRKNTPTFFDSSEESDFHYYLENEIEDYFVYEENFQIIGAGGINYFLDEKYVRFSWDMIHPKSQGKRIGTKLTDYRIDSLKSNSNVEIILVRTSQLVYKFYEKMGFKLETVEKDFWAKNFDLYQLSRKNKQ